jgi:hypothetical protein
MGVCGFAQEVIERLASNPAKLGIPGGESCRVVGLRMLSGRQPGLQRQGGARSGDPGEALASIELQGLAVSGVGPAARKMSLRGALERDTSQRLIRTRLMEVSCWAMSRKKRQLPRFYLA